MTTPVPLRNRSPHQGLMTPLMWDIAEILEAWTTEEMRFFFQRPIEDVAHQIVLDCNLETPGTWSLPPEPGPEVTTIRDAHGNLWGRHPDGSCWGPLSRDGVVGYNHLTWQGLMVYQPLTDATAEVQP